MLSIQQPLDVLQPRASIPHTSAYPTVSSTSSQVLGELTMDTEEEATQPATQQFNDERRFGQGNSGLTDEDAADIICVLYPMSINANRVADQIFRNNPENTLETRSDLHIRKKNDTPEPVVNTFEVAAEGLTPCGIALRLSAVLKDPLMGFQFGRNAERCDFPIGTHDMGKRVSNHHFRIYINEHCVIMIEDQSTNGTLVDRIMLKSKEKENQAVFRHTLESGQRIILTGNTRNEGYTFMTWIPNRSDEAELAYQENVTNYFRTMGAHRDHLRANPPRGQRRNGNPVNLFPTPAAATPAFSPLSTFGKQIREWKGGNKYNRAGQLGKGAFAVVYKVTTKFNGTPYAAKELEKRRFMKNGILDQKMDMEMRIMSRIQHDNIVKYIEHIDWEDYLYIIMEYVPGGDLGTLINSKGPLDESDVKDMADQLLSALGYLHGEGVTHRDVKPDNILISSNSPFHVKLTDFGLSKMVENEHTALRTFCGTLLYCAPEVYTEYREYDGNGKRTVPRGKDKRAFTAARYDHAVDIWSLAGVLFFALCGSPPYPASNGSTYMAILNRIMTEPLDIRPLQLVGISENGIRFVRQMLHIRPEHRATVQDLQNSPWLLGDDEIPYSLEEDLEQGTSQLSLRETNIEQVASQLSPVDNRQIDDSVDFGQSMSDITEMLPREIPGSFSDGTSTGESNYNYDHHYANDNINNSNCLTTNNGNGRLFGEINVSDVGSSGAIPLDPQLDLPLPSANSRQIHPNLTFSEFEGEDTENDENLDPSKNDHFSQQAGVIPSTEAAIIIAPPVQRLTNTQFKPSELQRRLLGQGVADRAVRSSSLMGTESMVGQLNMDSPAAAASPSADSAAAEPGFEMTTSLRRPREEGLEDDENWQPVDLPPKRRRKSAREIDMPVPHSIFWDPADKSTHHNNYPPMYTSDYSNLKGWSKSRGEVFEAGNKSFENTMQSFHRSRSRSSSFGETSPASDQTELSVNEGRHGLMKRDVRTLGVANAQAGPSRRGSEDLIPPTAGASHAASPIPPSDAANVTMDAPASSPSPALDDNFQLPRRVMAKFVTTPDSCIPNVNISITEEVTSWGRARDCTIRYPNIHEGRIPKYAFKIMLFEAGPRTDSEPKAPEASSHEDNKAFYISTKASQGIMINDFKLLSYNPDKPKAVSRFWGELRHGDLVTIWKEDERMRSVTRFRFECYFGRSKNPRDEGEKFQLNTNLSFLAGIEHACAEQHETVLKERERANKESTALAKD